MMPTVVASYARSNDGKIIFRFAVTDNKNIHRISSHMTFHPVTSAVTLEEIEETNYKSETLIDQKDQRLLRHRESCRRSYKKKSVSLMLLIKIMNGSADVLVQ